MCACVRVCRYMKKTATFRSEKRSSERCGGWTILASTSPARIPLLLPPPTTPPSRENARLVHGSMMSQLTPPRAARDEGAARLMYPHAPAPWRPSSKPSCRASTTFCSYSASLGCDRASIHANGHPMQICLLTSTWFLPWGQRPVASKWQPSRISGTKERDGCS